MASHHAQLVNLDTHTHVDAKGVEQKTGPHNKAEVGPHTVIIMAPHPAMKYADHVRLNTHVAKHMQKMGNPHPNAIAKVLAAQVAKGPSPPSPMAPPMGAPAPAPMMAGMPPR